MTRHFSYGIINDQIWGVVDHNHNLPGLIPHMISADDPAPITEQLHRGYSHGGGWQPFHGFTLVKEHETRPETWYLDYPEDPPTMLLAYTVIRGYYIMLFEHSWVAVAAPNGEYEIARMD